MCSSLIRPAANMSRRVREMDEFIGGDLDSHLQAAGDLVVIADEHHVYRAQARAFSSAILTYRRGHWSG